MNININVNITDTKNKFSITQQKEDIGFYIIWNKDFYINPPYATFKKPKGIREKSMIDSNWVACSDDNRDICKEVHSENEDGEKPNKSTEQLFATYIPFKVPSSNNIVIVTSCKSHSSYSSPTYYLMVYKTIETAVEESLDCFFDEHYPSECEHCKATVKLNEAIAQLNNTITEFKSIGCCVNCKNNACECQKYIPTISEEFSLEYESFCYKNAETNLIKNGHCGFYGVGGKEGYDYYLSTIKVK